MITRTVIGAALLATGLLAQPDVKFVRSAAEGGKMEVDLADYAIVHASSEQVREYARMLKRDHTKANAELLKIAQSKSIDLDTSKSPKTTEAISKYSNLRKTEFDRAYIKDQIEDHEKDVDEFQKEVESGSDVQFKNFAMKALATLKEHLAKAKSLQHD